MVAVIAVLIAVAFIAMVMGLTVHAVRKAR
jgi:hypothetical protein